jgi:hypothetical protein
MMRRMLLAMVLVLCAAGCGDSDAEPPRASSPAPTATAGAAAAATVSPTDPVAAAIERYAAAVRAGDAATICSDLLSRAVLERVKSAGGDCERDLIADAVAAGGPAYKVVVESVQFSGSDATARSQVTDRRGTRAQTQPLVREGGRWKLTVGG